jgi:hypothetical protein
MALTPLRLQMLFCVSSEVAVLVLIFGTDIKPHI